MMLPPQFKKIEFPHLKGSPSLAFLFGLALMANVSGLVALFATFTSLPPSVPLLPAAVLAGKGWLFAISIASFFFVYINAAVVERLLGKNEEEAAIFPAFMTTFVSILLSSSLFRLVKLYPTAAIPLEELFYPLLLPFIAAALMGLILTTAIEQVSRRWRLFDKPHGPYPEVRSIPRLGAIPLYLAFAVAALAFVGPSQQLVAFLIGGGIIALIQSIDDLRPLPFWLQGIGHLLAAAIVVAGGIGIEYIRNPLYPYAGGQLFFLNQWNIPVIWQGVTYHITVLADLLTVVWIFALVNVVDWLDGLDGLAAGVGAIAGLAITAISFTAGTPVTALLGAILFGALAGFLPANLFPARIYLGGGAFLVGYILAVLSIFSGAKTGTALLVLALPIMDALYVIYRRIREKRSPFKGDTTHLHHRLLEKGLTPRKIVFVEWGIVALLAAVAVIFSGFYKLLGLAVVFIGGLLANKLLLQRSASKSPKEDGASFESNRAG